MLDEAKKKNLYKKVICAALNDQRIPEIETGEFDALICCGTLVQGHAHSNAFVEMIRMVKINMFSWLRFKCHYDQILDTHYFLFIYLFIFFHFRTQ